MSTKDNGISANDQQLIEEATKSATATSDWPKDEDNIPHKHQKRSTKLHKSHGFRRFILALLFMLIIVASAVAYLVFFVAGPLINAVESLPADFPKDIAIYQLDQAKIQVQSATARAKFIQLVNSLPDWSLAPLINYITTDAKTQILAGIKDPNALPENININELTKQLQDRSQSLATKTETVGLEWKNLPKTKDEVFDYYQKQLESKGYTVEKKITDYEIDLSFFKPGIDGAMTIADSFMKDNSSIVKMTVNYFRK